MHFNKLPLLFSLFLYSSLAAARFSLDLRPKTFEGITRCGFHTTKEQRIASRKRFINAKVAPRRVENNSSEINTYFHVVAANKTTEGGWITDEQIRRQMEVLNEDYSYTGLSFKFMNTTRVINETWFRAMGVDEDVAVAMEPLRYGGPADLNVFSLGLLEGGMSKTLGFATPPDIYEESFRSDGVYIKYSSFPGGSLKEFSIGRTLTHEAGHWLGLIHTFEGGCKEGDEVDDTPPEAEPAYGCPVGRDSCKGGERDSVHNFMNYGDDYCLTDEVSTLKR